MYVKRYFLAFTLLARIEKARQSRIEGRKEFFILSKHEDTLREAAYFQGEWDDELRTRFVRISSHPTSVQGYFSVARKKKINFYIRFRGEKLDISYRSSRITSLFQDELQSIYLLSYFLSLMHSASSRDYKPLMRRKCWIFWEDGQSFLDIHVAWSQIEAVHLRQTIFGVIARKKISKCTRQ